jgi:pimeloyl-ACP methyl ester carboxylesterase
VAVERTVSLSELDVVVSEAGVGGRPLLLLHGLTGAKEDFRDAVDRLADEGFWVVAPDQRGHGATGGPDDESAYTLDRFAADAVELVEALGWERTDVLGHSLGGMIAQVLVLDRPDLVGRLVLMDTAPGEVAGMDVEIMQLGVELCRAEGMAAVLAVMKMGDGALDTPAHQRLLAEVPGLEEWEDRKFLDSSAAMWSAMVTALIEPDDRTERLRAVSSPTLVLVGDQDTPFLEASRVLAEVIPDARLAVLPGGGHQPQLECPEAWWDELSAFLGAGVSASSP